MKLKYKLIDKLAGLSRKELDFLLYIVRFQDETGKVEGVYYKDVCWHTGMCKQTFYNILSSLSQKGIIRFERICSEENQDYNILILDNDFSYLESYREGYVSLNRKLFRRLAWRQLKAREKYMLLDLMRYTCTGQKRFTVTRKDFFERYTDSFQSSCQVIRTYLPHLKKLFSFRFSRGIYTIEYRQELDHFQENKKTGAEQRREYNACVLFRRSGEKAATQWQIKEVADLIAQYTNKARIAGKNLSKLLLAALMKARQETGKEFFDIKLIHRLLRNSLLISS